VGSLSGNDEVFKKDYVFLMGTSLMRGH
jgi:hypothetical protein